MSEHLCNTVSQSIKPSHFLSKACLKKYLVVSHRITIIYNMGSYKLYVAVMAIASIVAVQEINCTSKSAKRYSEPINVFEPEINDYQCTEYKSRIWDKAFSNMPAMKLMDLTFSTAKDLSTQDVCSDTTRAFLNFINVMATDPNVKYSLSMFNKMLAFIIREADKTSVKFIETKKVFERIANDEEIHDYVKNFTVKTFNFLKTPGIIGRLLKVVKAFGKLRNASAKTTKDAVNMS